MLILHVSCLFRRLKLFPKQSLSALKSSLCCCSNLKASTRQRQSAARIEDLKPAVLKEGTTASARATQAPAGQPIHRAGNIPAAAQFHSNGGQQSGYAGPVNGQGNGSAAGHMPQNGHAHPGRMQASPDGRQWSNAQPGPMPAPHDERRWTTPSHAQPSRFPDGQNAAAHRQAAAPVDEFDYD